MGMQKNKPRCVLCQTCANWLRTRGPERRSSTRMCSAGMNPTADLYECDSYVSRFLTVVPVSPAKQWRTAGR